MSGRLRNHAGHAIGTLAGVTLFIYCSYADAAASLSEVTRSLNIDKTQISVSGISSGGFMAHQFHVAHSFNVMGAGIVAGGPYYCAQGSIADAVRKCSEFMALECNLPGQAAAKDRFETPITGLAGSFIDFCRNPYTGPRTDEQQRRPKRAPQFRKIARNFPIRRRGRGAGIARAMYVAVCKDTDEIHIERVRVDTAAVVAPV
jgi:hypothetical protein